MRTGWMVVAAALLVSGCPDDPAIDECIAPKDCPSGQACVARKCAGTAHKVKSEFRMWGQKTPDLLTRDLST